MNAVRIASGGAALLDDDRIELVASMNRENLVPILDAEQPLPSAAIEEQASEGTRAVVRVQAGGDDESPGVPP